MEDQGCDLGVKGVLRELLLLSFFCFFLMQGHEDTVFCIILSSGTAGLFFKPCFSLTFNFEILTSS